MHRLPLDQSGEPQVQTGMNLAHGTEVLHQSMWGVIYQISVLTPTKKKQKMGPFWVGWWTSSPMSRTSYYAVAMFTAENNEAWRLMEAMIQAHPVQYTYVHACMCRALLLRLICAM